MLKFAAVKETSIYNDLKELVDADTDLKERLNSITEYLYKKYNLKSYFCKLYGARWSFLAGDNDILIAVKRFKISDEFGLIIEDNNSSDAVYTTIIAGLKTVLNP